MAPTIMVLNIGPAHRFCEMAVANKNMHRAIIHHVGNTQIEFVGDPLAKLKAISSVHSFGPPRTGKDLDGFLAGRYRRLHEKRMVIVRTPKTPNMDKLI